MTRSDLDNNGAHKVPKCQCQLSGVQVQGCGSKLRKVGVDDDDADDEDDAGDAAPAADDD